MAEYRLEFEKLLQYDVGENGITVNTTLKLSDKSVSFPAKIDTGSSICIFERKYGEQLGFEIENGLFQKVGTATGIFIAYGFRVILQIEDFQFDSLVYFAKEESFNRNVLGRHGWLELVRIGIIDYEGKLFLSRYLD
jgi:hypothetical protein